MEVFPYKKFLHKCIPRFGIKFCFLFVVTVSAWSFFRTSIISSSMHTIRVISTNVKLPKHARECVSFYKLLEEAIAENKGNRNNSKTNLSLIGAYAYPDYSVVTIEADGWYGNTVYCHYFDGNWNKINSPVKSVVFPEFAIHCCRHPKALYMSITEKKEEEVMFLVPVLDRTMQKPKYDLSVCLAPMYGNESKWLMLTELIEHYKLQGVQHFYVYINDIDDYSHLVVDDYEKSGEIEVVHFRKVQDRPILDWHLVGVQDCLQRSRYHSRYAIFVDLDERLMAIEDRTLAEFIPKAMAEQPNTAMLQIRMRWVLRSRNPPEKYEGELTLKEHLPTLVFHNTSAVGPATHMPKCVIDPERVVIMWIHYVKIYFPGFKGVCVPPEKALIRHYRALNDNFGEGSQMPSILTRIKAVGKFGNFTMTNYPEHLMLKLYENVKKRLSGVYEGF